jgi:hypothetical protein
MILHMTTALGIGLVAWTVLPLPLAVLVGRSLRARGSPALDGEAPAQVAHPDLTLA